VTWLAKLYIWATYRLYDEFAWAYDLVSWLVSLGRWSEWRKSSLDYVAGQRVLEIGFGTGELLLEMARREMQVVGLELSTAMQRITTSKMARRGLDVPRLRGIVQAMPFADGQFDTVVSTFPATYILEPDTLQEVARLLRPPNPHTGSEGGRFVVVGMVVWKEGWLWRRAVRLLFGSGSGESAFSRFERIATAAGLRVKVIDLVDQGWHVPVIVARCVSQLQPPASGAAWQPVDEGDGAPGGTESTARQGGGAGE
jgi:ubiquinone/menaquinone biosynthesis C-methylase UbiE